jgi:hypothetical protein
VAGKKRLKDAWARTDIKEEGRRESIELVGDFLEFGPDVFRVRVDTQPSEIPLSAANASFVVGGAPLVVTPQRLLTI